MNKITEDSDIFIRIGLIIDAYIAVAFGTAVVGWKIRREHTESRVKYGTN